jgi:hypothetical protein
MLCRHVSVVVGLGLLAMLVASSPFHVGLSLGVCEKFLLLHPPTRIGPKPEDLFRYLELEIIN